MGGTRVQCDGFGALINPMLDSRRLHLSDGRMHSIKNLGVNGNVDGACIDPRVVPVDHVASVPGPRTAAPLYRQHHLLVEKHLRARQ